MSHGTTYLVTGSTGFIGRFLVERLAARGGDVFLLVRHTSVPAHRERFDAWEATLETLGGSLTVVPGDVAAPGLALDDDLDDVAFDHVFNFAGYYDITGDEELMWKVNVDGTRFLLEWLEERAFEGVFHHASSVAVAGDYEGEFPEDELELEQSFAHPYLESKYEAERLVRDSELRWRCYRPSAVVGHSETGEADRIDGPYYLFKALQKLRYALPGWFPLLGYIRGRLNMVPVDFVTDAIEHIAHAEGYDGKTFHIADPDPPNFQETFNLLADVAGAPKIAATLGGRLKKLIPDAASVIGSMGLAAFARRSLLSDMDIPDEIHQARNFSVRYDTSNLEDALVGSGITCPRQEDYVRALWSYYERHLDPDRDHETLRNNAFSGKRVLITGGSSGVGRALSLLCADHGSEVIVVARSEDKLQDVVGACAELGAPNADYYAVDLTDMEACDDLVSSVLDDHGPIDILVNNAAHSIRRTIEEEMERPADYERVMKLNFHAPVRLCLGFLPGMQETGGGHVVSVLTAGTHIPTPHFSAYVSSKAALDAFTDTLAAEFHHENIHTTSAYLPWVKTPMMTATEKYAEKAEKDDIMTPEGAAEWIMDGVTNRDRRLKSATTTRRFVFNVIFPTFMTRALSAVYRIYHDEPEQFPEFEVDRQVFRQFFETDLV